MEAALVEVGAPQEAAVALAGTATVETHEGVLVLCLNGACVEIDADDVGAGAIDDLAANAAADNAEAVDRQRRGEDETPWWPLPGRPRRR